MPTRPGGSELASSQTTGPYHYDRCREHWALVLDGAPTLRHPDENTYVLRVPGQTGYRFRLTDQLRDYWDGEPGAGPT
jgi:hypothetical protein